MPAADTVVIVVHYGRAETTRRCVESVRASDGAGADVVQIIVVDNGSPIPYSEPPGAGRTRIIRSETNRGYAGAINLAMASLPPRQDPQTARCILLLNNDIVLDRRCLLALRESGRRDALLAPLLFDRFGGRPTDWGETVNTFTIHHRALARVPDEDTSVEFVTGAALFADEEVFRKIGPWDERFFLYGEDFDYCLRARRLGIELRVVRSAVASHAKGAASGQGLNPFNVYYIHRNRVLLARNGTRSLATRASCRVRGDCAVEDRQVVRRESGARTSPGRRLQGRRVRLGEWSRSNGFDRGAGSGALRGPG